MSDTSTGGAPTCLRITSLACVRGSVCGGEGEQRRFCHRVCGTIWDIYTYVLSSLARESLTRDFDFSSCTLHEATPFCTDPRSYTYRSRPPHTRFGTLWRTRPHTCFIRPYSSPARGSKPAPHPPPTLRDSPTLNPQTCDDIILYIYIYVGIY